MNRPTTAMLEAGLCRRLGEDVYRSLSEDEQRRAKYQLEQDYLAMITASHANQ